MKSSAARVMRSSAAVCGRSAPVEVSPHALLLHTTFEVAPNVLLLLRTTVEVAPLALPFDFTTEGLDV